MRKFAVVAFCCVWGLLSAAEVWAAGPAIDASGLFVRAFLLIQEGDDAGSHGDFATAQTRYQDAMVILNNIEKAQPDWNPHIISFRKRYCEQHIADAKSKAAVAPPAAPVVTTPAAQPTPPATAPAVPSTPAPAATAPATPTQPAPPAAQPVPGNDMSREVEQLRQQVKRLQEERTAAAERAAVAAKDSDRVQLLQKELELMHKQVEQLTAEKARTAQAAPAGVVAGSAAADVSQIAKTSAEQLARMGHAIDSMRAESKQLALKLATAEHEVRENAVKISELAPLSDLLTAAKVEIESNKQKLAAKDQDLTKSQEQLKAVGDLQKINADLKRELGKTQALIATSAGHDQEAAKASEQLKQQVEELKGKLQQSEQKNQELARKSAESEQTSAAKTNDRAAQEKENAVLRAALDGKTAEYQKAIIGAEADRKKVSDLENELRELKKQMSVLELSARKPSTEEESYLKKPEVVVNPPTQKSVSGEITTNVRRQAKENALAEATTPVPPASAPAAAAAPAAPVPPPPAPEAAPVATPKPVPAAEPMPATKPVAEQAAPVAKPATEPIPAPAPVAAPAPMPAAEPAPAPKPVAAPEPAAPAAPAVAAPAPTPTFSTPDSIASSPETVKTPVVSIAPELKPLVDEARELYNQKKFEEAAAKYRELLKKDPENLVGLSNLAVIRFQQERYDEAEHLLERALQAAPDDSYSHSIIGIIYFKQDRNDDAINHLTRSVKLNTNNAEAHNYLGIACWKKGWRSAAEQELRKAIEIRPDYADAHYNLAVIYASQKPPFLGLSKFHYRKTLELGRQRDPNLEKVLASEMEKGNTAKPVEEKK